MRFFFNDSCLINTTGPHFNLPGWSWTVLSADKKVQSFLSAPHACALGTRQHSQGSSERDAD